MNTADLAYELIKCKTEMIHIPANRELAKIVKGELYVLNYLYTHHRAVHPKELSENMLVSTARIAALLNNMEKNGLITREHKDSDNRFVSVSITKNGIDRIVCQRSKTINYVASVIESIGTRDMEEYIRIQKKIIATIKEGSI